MGAAGILETILSMRAVEQGVVLSPRGYAACGVSHPLKLSAEQGTTERDSNVKLLSGNSRSKAAKKNKRRRNPT